MKIVINSDYGGYSLSQDALIYMGIEDKYYPKRDDSNLVECVEFLKEKANGKWANLKIVEIPDNIDWVIEEYDGKEWVAERHQTWH